MRLAPARPPLAAPPALAASLLLPALLVAACGPPQRPAAPPATGGPPMDTGSEEFEDPRLGERITFGAGVAAFADRVVQAGEGTVDAEAALGPPDGRPARLPCGAALVLELADNVMTDTEGPDLHVFWRAGGGHAPAVSFGADGNTWLRPAGDLDIATHPALRAGAQAAAAAGPGAEYRFVRLEAPAAGCPEGAVTEIDAVGVIGGRAVR